MMRAASTIIFGILCPLALACTAALSLPVEAQAQVQSWPTTEFVFENTDPKSDTPKEGDPYDGFTAEQSRIVADYEVYLAEVAKYYQSLGFKAPLLPITRGHNGGKAYRVYAFTFPPNDRTAKAGHFDDRSADLRFDISRAVVDGKPTPRSFEDLAHELFHDIQFGYPTYFQAEHGNWIDEGQAQAMGMEAAKRLRGIDAWTAYEDYRLGGRSYQLPLPTETWDDTYRTASFWRYLAERTTANRRNGHAGVAPIAADYSYLAKVYQERFADPPSAKNDLKWLDAGLRRAFGLSLNRLYPAFAATFAGYVPARLLNLPAATRYDDILNPSYGPAHEVRLTESAEKSEDIWLRRLFGPCPTISLGQDIFSSSATHKLAIARNASACFKVEATGAGPVSINIQTRASTVEKLWSLWIAPSGSDRIQSPTFGSSPVGGGYLGGWTFAIAPGKPQVFIISNVAEHAETSVTQNLTLDITASLATNSMASPQPGASPGPENPSATDRRRSTRTAAPAAATGEQTADAGMTDRSDLGARTVFERDRPKCGESFAVAACGPRTTIRLSAIPGALQAMMLADGRGSITGQFIGQMSTGAKAGLASELMAGSRSIAQTAGSSVHIVIPAIDYGFTGTFDTASITVNGGEGHGTYQALGPEDSSPGGDRVFLQAGHVTIEEFTPFVLRGTFEAQLTDMSQVMLAPGDVDQALPVHRTIKGSFVVGAPWKSDPTVQVYRLSGDPAQASLQDLVQSFPILGTMDLSDFAPPSPLPDGTAMPPSPVGAFPACDCSCQAAGKQTGLCGSICLVAVQQAEESATRQAALTAGRREQASLVGAVDRMRSDFSAFLTDRGVEIIREDLLKVFDEQPTAEAKRFMLFTYGMPVDSYGD